MSIIARVLGVVATPSSPAVAARLDPPADQGSLLSRTESDRLLLEDIATFGEAS